MDVEECEEVDKEEVIPPHYLGKGNSSRATPYGLQVCLFN